MTTRSLILRSAVLLLALLLAVLGYLQYMWLGSLSESEAARMRANVQASATHFAEDFDSEITALYKTFLNVDPMEAQPETKLSQAAQQWQQSSDARLLEQIYLILSKDGKLQLLQWDSTNRRLKQVPWENDFSEVRKLCERLANEVEPEPLLPPVHGFPALLIPGVKARRQLVAMAESGWILLIPDRRFLEQRLMPKLYEKYFASRNELLYDIAVVSKSDPNQMILASRSNLRPAEMNSPDAASDIFHLRLNDLMVAEVLVTTQQPHSGDRTEVNEHNSLVLRTLPESPEKPGTTVVKQENQQTVRTFPWVPPQHSWRAIFKHRAGSLETVVSNVRRRNLLISFSILLLLAAAIFLILVESRRASNLAKQQMQFVAGVSHELRTPLAVICSAAENLADAVVDDPQQIRRYGGLIRDEGRRLAEMIQHVLDFGGIQSGQKRERVLISLPDLIAKVIADAARTADGTIEADLEKDLPGIVGDRLALESALTNLIDNARKYAAGANAAAIRIEGRANHHGSHPEVILSVSDNGPGISAGDLLHIFEPFYRGANALAAHIRGSGLGLSVVQQVAASHGGSVSVKSGEGKGTCFIIRLPAGKRERA